MLGLLGGGGGNDIKRPVSAPLTGLGPATATATTAAAPPLANSSGAAKAGSAGAVDMEIPPADKMHQALIRIFCTLLREQPAVVILEDVHDMDEESWKVGPITTYPLSTHPLITHPLITHPLITHPHKLLQHTPSNPPVITHPPALLYQHTR